MNGENSQIKNVAGYTWIVQNPDLLGGQPAIKGTRLAVAFVLECLAAGMTPEEIDHDYGDFPVACVPEALKFAAEHLKKIA